MGIVGTTDKRFFESMRIHEAQFSSAFGAFAKSGKSVFWTVGIEAEELSIYNKKRMGTGRAEFLGRGYFSLFGERKGILTAWIVGAADKMGLEFGGEF